MVSLEVLGQPKINLRRFQWPGKESYENFRNDSIGLDWRSSGVRVVMRESKLEDTKLRKWITTMIAKIKTLFTLFDNEDDLNVSWTICQCHRLIIIIIRGKQQAHKITFMNSKNHLHDALIALEK